jgi:hypothetical protein
MKQNGVFNVSTNPTILERYFIYREPVHVGDHTILVTKYHFTFNRDIMDAIDKMEEVIK